MNNISVIITFLVITGVIFVSMEFLISLFKKDKANKEMRNKINNKVQNALTEHNENYIKMQKQINDLQQEFQDYRTETEANIDAMDKYVDKIVETSNQIIAFNAVFDEKLNLWYKLLSNPDNAEAVREQIQKFISRDLELHSCLQMEAKEQRELWQKYIDKSFGMDFDL